MRFFVLSACLLLVVTSASAALPLPVPGGGLMDPEVYGSWDSPFGFPVKAEHQILLATGKVLAFESQVKVVLWDPVDGNITDVTLGGDDIINCAGLSFLPDGRVVVNGGFGPGPMWAGNNKTYLFDPFDEAWSEGPDMGEARYYPTTLSLGDGRVLTMSGNEANGLPAETVEVLSADGTQWQPIEGLDGMMDMFPRLHVLADGTVVRVAQEKETLFLDVDAGTWREGPSSSMHRWGTTSVLLPGLDQVLVVGGGSLGGSGEGSGEMPLHRSEVDEYVENSVRGIMDGGGPATATAEILDLSEGTEHAHWTPTGSMHIPRRDHTAVLLPDGSVMVFNGGTGNEPVPGWVDHSLAPERFDPETGQWDLMAPSERHRGYHSAATLLPDGRVLVGGGDFEWATGTTAMPLDTTAEVYSPPYLFWGERPQIDQAPGQLTYGEGGFVKMEDAGDVSKVVLMRAATATHSINPDQRAVELQFETILDEGLVIQAPEHGNEAPPGWYMLFVFNEEGVPAHAPMVHVG